MSDPSIKHANRFRHQPRRWQFGLRTLLLAMLGLSALFALMSLFGTSGKVMIAWIAILVFGHVWATAVGSYSRRWQHPAEDQHQPLPRPRQQRPPSGNSPPSKLWQQASIQRQVRIPTFLGAALGGTAGTFALATLYSRQGVYFGILLGGISAAAIGGLLGFMASSCLHVAASAWREAALYAHRPAEPPRPSKKPPDKASSGS